MSFTAAFNEATQAHMLATLGERVRVVSTEHSFDKECDAVVEEIYDETPGEFQVSGVLFTVDLLGSSLPPNVSRHDLAEFCTVTLLGRDNQVVKVGEIRGLGADAFQLACVR